jgi:hypothetical protein
MLYQAQSFTCDFPKPHKTPDHSTSHLKILSNIYTLVRIQPLRNIIKRISRCFLRVGRQWQESTCNSERELSQPIRPKYGIFHCFRWRQFPSKTLLQIFTALSSFWHLTQELSANKLPSSRLRINVCVGLFLFFVILKATDLYFLSFFFLQKSFTRLLHILHVYPH